MKVEGHNDEGFECKSSHGSDSCGFFCLLFRSLVAREKRAQADHELRRAPEKDDNKPPK